MSIQDIFAHEPAQREFDDLANRHARLYIAALKAATNVVDEVNRAEPIGVDDVDADPEPKKPEHIAGALVDAEVEPEGPLMGMDEILHIADEIFKALVQQVILMNQVSALAGATPPAPDAPAPEPPAEAAHRRMPVRSPIVPKTA